MILFKYIQLLSPGMNPMCMLDQDQMNKLESVLQSDEAKNFLEEVNMICSEDTLNVCVR